MTEQIQEVSIEEVDASKAMKQGHGKAAAECEIALECSRRKPKGKESGRQGRGAQRGAGSRGEVGHRERSSFQSIFLTIFSLTAARLPLIPKNISIFSVAKR